MCELLFEDELIELEDVTNAFADSAIGFEDKLTEWMMLKERISKMDPEIRKILLESLGENLNADFLLPENDIVLAEALIERLEQLKSPRDQKIILMRFGLITGEPMTLQEVADYFGITRERVRSVEYKFAGRRPCIRRRRMEDFLNQGQKSVIYWK